MHILRLPEDVLSTFHIATLLSAGSYPFLQLFMFSRLLLVPKLQHRATGMSFLSLYDWRDCLTSCVNHLPTCIEPVRSGLENRRSTGERRNTASGVVPAILGGTTTPPHSS